MKINLSFFTVVLVLAITGVFSPLSGQWEVYQISRAPNPVPSIYLGDLDGDDMLDVVGSHNVTGDVFWYKNKNAGLSWEEYTIDDNLPGAWLVLIADVDGDDTMDVVATGQDANDVVWYENDQLSWKKHFIDTGFNGARDIAVADIDGDSTLDVIATSLSSDDVVWYENNLPDTSWIQYTIDEDLDGANYIYPTDLDGDGDPDLIVTAWSGDRIVWYENNHLIWNRYNIDPNIDGPVIVDVADLDGDGDLDIAATADRDDVVVWYENDQPTWKKHIIDGNLGRALGVAIVDVDGDDVLDVVAAGMSAHKVVWYKNNLPNDSWTPSTIGYLDYAEIVDVGDIDGDNDPDVVSVSFGYYDGLFDVGDVVWYQHPGITLETHQKYISTQGETLFITGNVFNPEIHPESVFGIIQAENSSFQDSIRLYDDGMHSDENTNDNIWANSKWITGLEEDYYMIGLSAHDITGNQTNYLLPDRRFTTIGPIELAEFKITSPDTVPEPGDQISIKLYLKNGGQTVTALNVTTPKELISLDTNATIKATLLPKYGDIAPGETSAGKRNYTITFSEESVTDKDYLFVINILSDEVHWWNDTLSVQLVTGIEDIREKLPIAFVLQQNFPNPFNPKTVINYELPMTNYIDLSIYNLLGQKVATLVSEKQKPGTHQVEWDAGNFSSGVYYYQIRAGEFVDVKKMVLLR